MRPIGDERLRGPGGRRFIEANGCIVVLREEGERIAESGGEDDAIYAREDLANVRSPVRAVVVN